MRRSTGRILPELVQSLLLTLKYSSILLEFHSRLCFLFTSLYPTITMALRLQHITFHLAPSENVVNKVGVKSPEQL